MTNPPRILRRIPTAEMSRRTHLTAARMIMMIPAAIRIPTAVLRITTSLRAAAAPIPAAPPHPTIPVLQAVPMKKSRVIPSGVPREAQS